MILWESHEGPMLRAGVQLLSERQLHLQCHYIYLLIIWP